MRTLEELKRMTVAELRKYAREQGVTLSSQLNKASIIESIDAARLDDGETPTIIAPPRQAVIVSDGDDDVPVMTVNRAARPLQREAEAAKPQTPSVSIPRPTPPPPRGNKPAFTLQGARAWHNPNPYVAASSQSKYQPISTQGGALQATGEARLSQPVRPATFNRFGPKTDTEEETPKVYRPSYMNAVRDLLRQEEPASASPAQRAEEAPQSPLRRDPMAAPAQPSVDMMSAGDVVDGSGVLEIMPDGFGFLRVVNYHTSAGDIYVSNAQIRRFELQTGDLIEGKVRPQREADKYVALLYVTRVNGEDVDERTPRRSFETLTPVYPAKKIKLSSRETQDKLLRLIDLFAPLGLGSRAVVKAASKERILSLQIALAKALKAQGDVVPYVLLVDERPETVTEVRESLGCEVVHASLDEPFENQAKSADLLLERCQRAVEKGEHVALVLSDTLSLSRAYRSLAPFLNKDGFSGACVNKIKHFIGSARNTKEGGSLTLIAGFPTGRPGCFEDALNAMMNDAVNCKIVLSDDETLMDLSESRTLRDEALLTRDENDVMKQLRAYLRGKSVQDASALTLSMLDKTDTNREFTSRFDGWMAMLQRQK